MCTVQHRPQITGCPRITNIKCHWRVPKKSINWATAVTNINTQDISVTSKVYPKHQIYVVRVHKTKKHPDVHPVFTIFATGYVNCTSIPSFAVLSSAVTQFCCCFQLSKTDLYSFAVDNISACGRLDQRINLSKIVSPDKYLNIHVHYQPERFPGTFLKFRGKGGCVGIFGNGKLTFLGAKSKQHLLYMRRTLNYILQMSDCKIE